MYNIFSHAYQDNIRNNLFLLLVLDMLFFPFIPIAKIPLGIIFFVPLVAYIGMANLKWSISIPMFFFPVLFSLILNYINKNAFFEINAKTSMIAVLAFLYLYIFSHGTADLSRRIVFFLKIYLYFVFGLAVIYIVDFHTYYLIRSFFTFSGKVLEYHGVSSINRFVGIMSDPNNCGCSMVALVSFLEEREEMLRKKIVDYLMLLIIVFSTMSVSAISLFGFMLFVKIAASKRIKIDSIIYSYFIVFLFVVCIIYVFDSSIGSIFETRIRNYLNNSTGEEGRLDKWVRIVSTIPVYTHLLWGEGGTILINNRIARPHNGHLYFIYNYGLLCCTIFNVYFFKYLKKYNWAWIFMINFTFNTVVNDYRATMIYVILTICSLYENDKSKIILK